MRCRSSSQNTMFSWSNWNENGSSNKRLLGSRYSRHREPNVLFEKMKRIIVIAVSIVGGITFAWCMTCLLWNIQIEGRAFQCDDWIPFANFETDMSNHREAADTLSPGWTWEKIEGIGRMYRVGFFVLWAGATATISTMWMKHKKQNKKMQSISA